jgi:hypothetical protein
MTGAPDPGKYARRERERRFLLRDLPAATPVKIATIVDRYLAGTRIRLRRSVERIEGGEVEVLKLTQKIPAPDGGPGLITTLYLSPEEYDLFAALPAAVLTKSRHSIPPFGIDVFEAPLDGLVLAEVEFGTDGEMRSFEPAIDVVAEVTQDIRFTGGNLVRTTRASMRRLLSEAGVGRLRGGTTGTAPSPSSH